jgi:hypothetical protein
MSSERVVVLGSQWTGLFDENYLAFDMHIESLAGVRELDCCAVSSQKAICAFRSCLACASCFVSMSTMMMQYFKPA